MKKFFEKFKFRFSYVLFVGIIGVIFQGIGFFTWKNVDVTATNLKSTTTMKHINEYLFSSYFIIVSAIFLIAMAVGYILLSKKEQLWTRISAYVLGGSQALSLIVTIVFISVLVANRKNMFTATIMSTGYKGVYIFEEILLLIKNICLVITSGAFASLSLSLMKINKQRSFSKIGTWISISTNGLFVLSMLILAFASIGLIPYQFVSRLFDGTISQSLSALKEFKSTYLNPNGFTLGQLNRAFSIVDQISTSVNPSQFQKLNASAVFAIISIISYLISMFGNLITLSLSTIDSYDLSRDDDKLAI